MGAVTKNQIPAVGEFMPRFWELIKATYTVEQCPQYWSQVLDKMQSLYETVQGSEDEKALCKALLHAYGDYLEGKG